MVKSRIRDGLIRLRDRSECTAEHVAWEGLL